MLASILVAATNLFWHIYLEPAMLTKTTRCEAFGHAEFSIECDGIWAETGTLRWFTDWLESSVQNGDVFLPEQTVQLGWSILKVSKDNEGCLTFSEPDFTSFPIRFVPGVSKSLHHLFIQKSIAESVGLMEEIDIPSLRMSAIICSKFSTDKPLFFSRSKPMENDSGWFFGCLDKTHDHNSIDQLQRVSLYDVALRHRFQVVPYLGLPAGIDVILVGKDIEIYRERKPLAIHAGSYLEQLQRGR